MQNGYKIGLSASPISRDHICYDGKKFCCRITVILSNPRLGNASSACKIPLNKETVLYYIYRYSRDNSVTFGLQAGFKLFILQAIHLQAEHDPRTRILQQVTGDTV